MIFPSVIFIRKGGRCQGGSQSGNEHSGNGMIRNPETYVFATVLQLPGG
jgi:hypothetical protein